MPTYKVLAQSAPTAATATTLYTHHPLVPLEVRVTNGS